jgi:hypothetical protein
MERDINYETTNIAYDDQYPEEAGGGIKCKNYELCNRVLPKWWFECKGNYVCTCCDMLYGILKMSDNIECPICFENKKGLSLMKCSHYICIDCFKRCHHGDQSGEPVFPYPDIEEKYFEDTENPIWVSDYPLITLYNEAWNNWENNKQEKYENEENLRKCPLCRK